MSNEKPSVKVNDRRRAAEPEPEPAAKAAQPSPTPPAGPIDFTTFIFSFAQTALIHLGVAPDPDGQVRVDPVLAHETIDILGMLREKTRGNLTDEEQRFFDSILYDLRVKYVEVAGKKR